jgi:2-dehydro-3-deoxyphosphogluconate aldolase/(4S)-4-hydroxy-2-oxoglutarate aldolase
MSHESVLSRIFEEKLIVIFRGISQEQIADIATAAVEGGAKFIEVTFDHKSKTIEQDFIDQITAVKNAIGTRACIGAGTVLTTQQTKLAKEMGAEYIVSPNTNKDVIELTKKLGMVSIPGSFSPTEIVNAWEYGADIVKLYIEEEPRHVKYLQGPLGHIPMQIVCNVSLETIPKFLNAGIKAFGTRAFITDDLIKNKDYAGIKKATAEFIQAIKTA